MAKKVSITRELIRAANISRRRRSESEQAYLNRIVLEVGGLSDDARASLSPEARFPRTPPPVARLTHLHSRRDGSLFSF
jgi:hypothetical protein